MNHILEKICYQKKITLEKEKEKCSFKNLEKLFIDKNNRNFKKLLIDYQQYKKINIIAEIKKASPSAGIIVKNYIPENIVIEYEQSGVGAISILTEENFFKGHIDNMSLIHKHCNLPILRKDFIIDSYQILQSKIYNADAILLIVSILSDNQIIEFIEIANNYGLDCLIETHTHSELERAININYPIIGINNRNLKTLNINDNTTLKLIRDIPENFTVVAESGIKNNQQIEKYNEAGIFNFLIGESLLTAKNKKNKVKELIKND